MRDGRPNLAARTPRAADGHPDLSGVWDAESRGAANPDSPVAGGAALPPEFVDVGARLKNGLPYRPWGLSIKNARQANGAKDNPDGLCLPISILHMHSNPLPRKIVQTPGLVAILYERNMEYRQIFTDGRPLPSDPEPSWRGYSSGRWNGDTLVVRTTGFREGLWADANGNPLSEAATMTERFRRLNYGTLQIEVTVDDPKAYSEPWTVTLTHYIKVDTDLLEYVCLENEQDRAHLVGR